MASRSSSFNTASRAPSRTPSRVSSVAELSVPSSATSSRPPSRSGSFVAGSAATANGTQAGPSGQSIHESQVDADALSAALANSNDLTALVRSGFELGKAPVLLETVKAFIASKTKEIEQLCHNHYEEFIHSVDDLQSVKQDARSLRTRILGHNNALQDAGADLLGHLDQLLEYHNIRRNITAAAEAVAKCKIVIELCDKVNAHLLRDNYYPVLKTLDVMESEHLQTIPSPAISRAAAQRQHEDDARARQEVLQGGSRTDIALMAQSRHNLEVGVVEDRQEDAKARRMELASLYRCVHLYHCLNQFDSFQQSYYENRKLQLLSDLQYAAGQPFLETYQNYFCQIAGFFVVEDRIQRTTQGLVTSAQVDALWEIAATKMAVLLREQFVKMQAAAPMLLVKDFLTLLCTTLGGYGYNISIVLDELEVPRERYQQLLLNDTRRQIKQIAAEEQWERMVIDKMRYYKATLLPFGLGPLLSGDHELPYRCPFSRFVPEVCRIAKSFARDATSFVEQLAPWDAHDIVLKQLDGLLASVANGCLRAVLEMKPVKLNLALVIAANAAALEKACDTLLGYVDRTLRISRRHSYGHSLAAQAAFADTQFKAMEEVLELVENRIEEIIMPGLDWCPKAAPEEAAAYINTLLEFLTGVLDEGAAILPPQACEMLHVDSIQHVAKVLIDELQAEHTKKFNLHGIAGMHLSLAKLEAFAEEQFKRSGLVHITELKGLKQRLQVPRQLADLLLSNQPEQIIDSTVRSTVFPALNVELLITILDKFKEIKTGDKLFSRKAGSPQKVLKKKRIEHIVDVLKDELEQSTK
eukprot:jgi/Chlat1/2788/Chrsp187S08763